MERGRDVGQGRHGPGLRLVAGPWVGGKGPGGQPVPTAALDCLVGGDCSIS